MGKSYQTSFSKQGPPPSSNSSLLDVLLNSVESRAGLAEAGSKTTSRPRTTFHWGWEGEIGNIECFFPVNKQLLPGSSAWIRIPEVAPTLPEPLRFEELPVDHSGALFFQLWGLEAESCHLAFPNKISRGAGGKV